LILLSCYSISSCCSCTVLFFSIRIFLIFRSYSSFCFFSSLKLHNKLFISNSFYLIFYSYSSFTSLIFISFYSISFLFFNAYSNCPI
jgi:hypothetical protein